MQNIYADMEAAEHLMEAEWGKVGAALLQIDLMMLMLLLLLLMMR